MITFMGVGFLLIGMLVFLVSATNPTGLGIYLALGVIIFSMGMVLSYVGLKSKSDEGPDGRLCETSITLPLSFVELEIEKSQQRQKAASGNKAFGFVLMSLGVFVLTVSGLFGFFLGSWPLMLLGIGLTLSGAALRSQ